MTIREVNASKAKEDPILINASKKLVTVVMPMA